jgi:proline dehydrogenase
MDYPKHRTIVNFDDTSIAFARLSTPKLRKTYAIFALMNQNSLVKVGTFFIKFALDKGLPIKKMIKNTIFNQFCGGETIEECQNAIDSLASAGVGTILDYSVEGEDDERVFDSTLQELLLTIHRASQQPEKIPFAVFKVTGLISTPLLEKVQKNEALTSNETEAYARGAQRIDTLCALAAQKNVRLFFDAEESWIQDTIDSLCYEQMAKHNQNKRLIIYNTYQMYRTASLENYKSAVQKGTEHGYTVGAKLVRGAYLEKERNRAAAMQYLDPMQKTKENTDRDFNESVRFSIENIDQVGICLGTHNEASCQLCVDLMDDFGIEAQDKRIYFAQLLGMSDNISFTLAKLGYNVAKYVPYGPVEAVMPYLFRRAEENTSISGQSSREFLLVKKEMKRRKS